MNLERAERLVSAIYAAVGCNLPNDPPYHFSDWIQKIHKSDDPE